MHDTLQSILAIQELDIKMIRLMRVKKEHQKEHSYRGHHHHPHQLDNLAFILKKCFYIHIADFVLV